MKVHLAESTSQDQNIYMASAHLQQESLSCCQTPGKNHNRWLDGSGIYYKADRDNYFLLVY